MKIETQMPVYFFFFFFGTSFFPISQRFYRTLRKTSKINKKKKNNYYIISFLQKYIFWLSYEYWSHAIPDSTIDFFFFFKSNNRNDTFVYCFPKLFCLNRNFLNLLRGHYNMYECSDNVIHIIIWHYRKLNKDIFYTLNAYNVILI